MSLVSSFCRIIKEAAGKTTKTRGSAASVAPTGTDELGGLASSPDSAPHHNLTASVMKSPTEPKKRPRETGNSSDPPPTSANTRRSQDERAHKKARSDKKDEIKTMILNTCLRRFEQFQKQQGRSQVLQSAKDLYSADLRNLLRKLKRACPEAYTQHMAQVEAAYDSWNTLNTKEGIPVDNEGPDSSELVLAGQKIEDSVFAFFDRESLLKLRPHLRGHTRLQMVLCNLHLPLNSFQELKANLEGKQNKNDVQRELESNVDEVLAWLSPRVSYPSPPDSPVYDRSSRRPQEIVMKVQVDHQTAVSKGGPSQPRKSDSQAGDLHREPEAALSSPVSDVQRPQHHPDTTQRATGKYHILSDEQLVSLLAQRPSMKGVGAFHPQSAEPLNAIGKSQRRHNQEHGTTSAISALTTEHSEPTEWGPSEEAALMRARSIQQQKANACADIQRQDRVALYSKLQTYGQAYKIVIDQLIDAQNGGFPPANLRDLQMPDTEACYYRLQSLWAKAGKIFKTEAEVEQLRSNIDMFYKFAICVREAHCLFRVVDYYGGTFLDVMATGWDLDLMRRLQTAMVDFAHEEPLIWSKPDVDAICAALQTVADAKAQSEGSQAYSFATAVAANQAAAFTGVDLAKGGNGPGIFPQPGNIVQQGQTVLPAHQLQQVLRHVLSVQPNVSGTITQAQIPTPVPQIAPAVSGADAMDLNPVCPAFEKRGCPNYDTCRMEHPDHLRSNAQCHGFRDNRSCQFGNAGGCRYSHQLPPTMLLPQNQNIVIPGAAADISFDDEIFYAPNGKPVDPTVRDNYCKNWSKGSCRPKNNKPCHRLHMHAPAQLLVQPGIASISGPPNSQPGFENVNHFQLAGQGVQTIHAPTQLTGRPPRHESPCKFEANGRHCTNMNCEFLHIDPRSFKYNPHNFVGQVLAPSIVQQPFGDATMSGAAATGDNRNGATTTQRPDGRTNIPCRNENSDKGCTSAKCKYKHSNPQSKNFRLVYEGYLGDTEQSQPLNNAHRQQHTRQGQNAPAHRALNDFTFDPALGGVHFASPQTPHIQPPPPQSLIVQRRQHDLAPPNIAHQGQGQGQAQAQFNNQDRGKVPKMCYKCGQVGHIQRDCPVGVQGGGGGAAWGGKPIGGGQAGIQSGGSESSYAESVI